MEGTDNYQSYVLIHIHNCLSFGYCMGLHTNRINRGNFVLGLTVEVNRDMVQLYYGFGIIHRSIPRFRIGTDEPEALLEALKVV